MPRPDPGPGFDLPPMLATPEAPERTPRRSRRLAQGAIVAALGAVAAGLAFSLPSNDGDEVADGSTTRVEADGPTASAALLASDDRIEIDGELTDRGSLTPSGALTLRLPDPSGSVTLDARGLTNLIEPAPGSDDGEAEASGDPATTTTTWSEPALPPESDWVDTGNGVLVPDLLLRIRFCESTNNYQAASKYSTARGAYQFLKGSWEWYGHAETTGVAQAHLATPAQQDQAALATLQAEGTGPWSESRPCWADPDIDPRYASARPSPATTTTAPTSTTGDGSTTTTTGSTSSSETTSTTVESTTTASSSTTSTTVPSTAPAPTATSTPSTTTS